MLNFLTWKVLKFVIDQVDEWIDVMLSKGINGLNDEFIALYSKTKPLADDYSIFTANQNSGKI